LGRKIDQLTGNEPFDPLPYDATEVSALDKAHKKNVDKMRLLQDWYADGHSRVETAFSMAKAWTRVSEGISEEFDALVDNILEELKDEGTELRRPCSKLSQKWRLCVTRHWRQL
jgi:hypothetical protein